MCKVLCGSLRCQLRTTHRKNQPNETFLDDPVSGGCWEFNLPAPLKYPELSRPGGPMCRSPALWTSDSYHNGFSGGTWTHHSPRTLRNGGGCWVERSSSLSLLVHRVTFGSFPIPAPSLPAYPGQSLVWCLRST